MPAPRPQHSLQHGAGLPSARGSWTRWKPHSGALQLLPLTGQGQCLPLTLDSPSSARFPAAIRTWQGSSWLPPAKTASVPLGSPRGDAWEETVH